MDDSCLLMSKTNARAITSGNADRYIAYETAKLTAGERSLLTLLKTHLHWDRAKRGILTSIALKVSTLAERQGVSKATIRRRLAGLKEAGEIVVVEHFSDQGRQLPSSFIFPKLTAWLNDLSVKDVLDAYTAGDEQYDETQGAREGVSSATPIKQGSYSKKNTYMRFLTKEDFLSVTGSVRYVPQLAGIIRKMRPGVDPDVIFRFFREWIAKDEFVLRSGKTFIGLLFQFSRWCKVPYINGFTKNAVAQKSKPPQSVDYSDVKPRGTDLVSEVRRKIFDHNPAQYKNWFHGASMIVEGQELIFRGETTFSTGYVRQHFDQFLRHVAGSAGLSARFAA